MFAKFLCRFTIFLLFLIAFYLICYAYVSTLYLAGVGGCVLYGRYLCAGLSGYGSLYSSGSNHAPSGWIASANPNQPTKATFSGKR